MCTPDVLSDTEACCLFSVKLSGTVAGVETEACVGIAAGLFHLYGPSLLS